MDVLYLLIPIALLLLVAAIKILMWAVRSCQYDDLDTEGKRILFDDPPASSSVSSPLTAKDISSDD